MDAIRYALVLASFFTASCIEKTVVVVTTGRTGSTTLMALLNDCMQESFIQGEDDLAIWWLYKYWMSVGSFEVYTPNSTLYPAMRTRYYSTSMPFYGKVLPDQVATDLKAMLLRTLTGGRQDVRIAGLKEIRWLDRISEQRTYSNHWALGRADMDRYFSTNQTVRLNHLLDWLGEMLPKLHVVVLTRDAATQSQSAWYATRPNQVSQLQDENKILWNLEPSNYTRLHQFTFEAMLSKNATALEELYSFLGEPYNNTCVQEVLGKHHSF